MLFGSPTSLSAVLLAFQAYIEAFLKSYLKLPTNTVANRTFITASSDEEWERAGKIDDLYILIRAARGNWDQEQIGGGGPLNYVEGIGVEFTIYWRLDVDKGLESTAFLTDATLGVMPFKDLFVRLHYNFFPTDNSGNCIFVQPVRPPRWENPPKPKDKQWGKVKITYDVLFRNAVGNGVAYNAGSPF